MHRCWVFNFTVQSSYSKLRIFFDSKYSFVTALKRKAELRIGVVFNIILLV